MLFHAINFYCVSPAAKIFKVDRIFPKLLYMLGVKKYGSMLLHIAFECIAIYYHIAIFDWILVKRHFIWEYGFWQ